jgi:hypothetical protein
MTTRFTKKGWLLFSVTVTLRLPLALLALAVNALAELLQALYNRIRDLMAWIPEPKATEEWETEQLAKQLRVWKSSINKGRHGN